MALLKRRSSRSKRRTIIFQPVLLATRLFARQQESRGRTSLTEKVPFIGRGQERKECFGLEETNQVSVQKFHDMHCKRRNATMKHSILSDEIEVFLAWHQKDRLRLFLLLPWIIFVLSMPATFFVFLMATFAIKMIKRGADNMWEALDFSHRIRLLLTCLKLKRKVQRNSKRRRNSVARQSMLRRNDSSEY